ncbi:hypothetical protein N7497_008686 [Penicillium chrysogenum]|uniref:Uncharacterized protein n=1 Tax=Penicillium chrysogenum TaxID=5076 RepID=A0ABQ8WKI6_PENCH|nr:hypothetical protein N7524_008376 [Penicillium chrysogenum]KAJ5270544.1 hypothetical protein N7505_006302 [Penicillium chrysogenum]KAJ6146704.1 hypothetical protein N7497_008686 [Penicillium chrysogenum]
MIPGGAVNSTPRSCVPGFRSLVCFIKMHCIKVLLLSNLWIRWRWPQDATSLLNLIWPLVPRPSPHFSR